MNLFKMLLPLVAVTLLVNAQYSHIWNAKNLRDIDGRLSLTPAGGTVLVDEDFSAPNDQWIEPKIFDNYTKIAYGEMDGVKCMVITRNPEVDPKTVKKFDTAWELRTKRFALPKDASKFAVRVKVRSNNYMMKSTRGHGSSWLNQLVWYNAQGKEFARSKPFSYNISSNDFIGKDVYGDVPAGAVSVEMTLGVDLPDLLAGEYLAMSQAKLALLPADYGFSGEGECLSSAFPVQPENSKVAIEGDFPKGTSASFQVATSNDVYGAEESWTPFAGADGRDGSWYVNNSVVPRFPADTKYMRLRIRLQGDGKATPSLKRIAVGDKSFAFFKIPNSASLPHAVRHSESPTLDRKAPFRFSMHSDIGVTPKLTSLKLNDKDAMAFASIDGGMVTVTPPDGFKQGLNFITVSMREFNGMEASQEMVCYIGETRKTNVVTMRDDGMTLIDGQPFFPIGLAFVKKCEHNGNSYDRLFQMMEDCGMNFARHHSGYNITVRDSEEFFAAADKHHVKLYLSSSVKGANDLDIRRLAKSIVLQNNLKHIAWDTGDDTAIHITPEQMNARYQAVKAIDPWRITTQANGLGDLADPTYSPFALYSDNFSPEIYPLYHRDRKPNSDENCVAVFISSLKIIKDAWKSNGCPVRSCWPLIGYFYNCTDYDRLPNAEELRAMTYQCIIHGSQGIIWYRYAGYRENTKRGFLPNEWEVLEKLAKEVSGIYDVLCDRASTQQPKVTVLSGEKLDSLGNDSVSGLLKDSGGKQWLFTATSVRTPVKASFTLPAGAKKVTEYFEKRPVEIKDGAITESFAPLGVHLYVIE